jgi:Zn-dependent protease with chaperone function
MDRLIAGKPRIRKFFASLERGLEDEEHLMSLADNTRLNARQAPSLYRLVEDVAASARMPTPRVFLDTQPEVNAWALGQHNPMIVLTSALVDEFTEAQVRAVVAHELGHIRCQHTFYRIVSQGFDPVASVASALPGGSLLALALRWHLMVARLKAGQFLCYEARSLLSGLNPKGERGARKEDRSDSEDRTWLSRAGGSMCV